MTVLAAQLRFLDRSLAEADKALRIALREN